VVITADGQMRGGKEIALKPAIDEALAMGGCEAIRNVVVYKRTGSAPKRLRRATSGGMTWCRTKPDVFANRSGSRRTSVVHPLHVGVDRQPKGVQHSSAGYLLQAMLTMKWTFDAKPADVFWCTRTSAG